MMTAKTETRAVGGVPLTGDRVAIAANIVTPHIQGLSVVLEMTVALPATGAPGLIAGQKAVPTASVKDISNFKLRKGVPIGAKVTLRGDSMYEFLDRLISVSLPRTRDFRGVKASGFDGHGNFTFGVKEQIIFPEIDLDKIKQINGMDITVVTTAKTNEEAKALLEEFGFPFTK